jgi:hypothetical protein
VGQLARLVGQEAQKQMLGLLQIAPNQSGWALAAVQAQTMQMAQKVLEVFEQYLAVDIQQQLTLRSANQNPEH